MAKVLEMHTFELRPATDKETFEEFYLRELVRSIEKCLARVPTS